MSTVVALLGILAVATGGTLLAEHLRFRHFWARGCMGRAWRDQFPQASKVEIRDFLSMFSKAFAFRKSRTLAFRPSDRLIDIYRTRYPLRGRPDMLELETLARDARKRYGVDLLPLWHEGMTLGEVFERTASKAAQH